MIPLILLALIPHITATDVVNGPGRFSGSLGSEGVTPLATGSVGYTIADVTATGFNVEVEVVTSLGVDCVQVVHQDDIESGCGVPEAIALSYDPGDDLWSGSIDFDTVPEISRAALIHNLIYVEAYSPTFGVGEMRAILSVDENANCTAVVIGGGLVGFHGEFKLNLPGQTLAYDLEGEAATTLASAFAGGLSGTGNVTAQLFRGNPVQGGVPAFPPFSPSFLLTSTGKLTWAGTTAPLPPMSLNAWVEENLWVSFHNGAQQNVMYGPLQFGSLNTSKKKLSKKYGGRVYFRIDAGPDYNPQEGQFFYKVLGSLSGTTPGLPLPGGVTLPLAFPDFYFDYTAGANAAIPDSFGPLDSEGRALAYFGVGPGDPVPVGLTAHHAYVLLDFASGTLPLASNPVGVTFVP